MKIPKRYSCCMVLTGSVSMQPVNTTVFGQSGAHLPLQYIVIAPALIGILSMGMPASSM